MDLVVQIILQMVVKKVYKFRKVSLPSLVKESHDLKLKIQLCILSKNQQVKNSNDRTPAFPKKIPEHFVLLRLSYHPLLNALFSIA
ncbi:hypothetical protein VNO77_25746 [Canavalia gladiata]|uniref:Uncharacterized protein n=1 Tax=Canavalia gladiata TaxID=3824 RepID=A0AAN9Q517_CANGL